MTKFDKLQKRLKDELDLDVVNMKRTYAGSRLKEAGAWVWIGELNTHMGYDIGSPWSVSDLLKEKNLESRFGRGICMIEIWPGDQ